MSTIGIEWVNKYHGRASDLSNNDDNARGFYNTLDGVRQFEWSDDMAWDQDFEQAGVGSPATGHDDLWADNVDICFFSGHGSMDGAFFGVTKYDDGTAKPTELALGDRQLEWMILDACQCLAWDSGNVFRRWDPAFHGLHFILGFHTTTSDSGDRGKQFADHLNAGWGIAPAWIKACEDTESSSTWWAYLRSASETADTYNDHWWGKGYVSPDPVGTVFYAYNRGSC